MRTKVLAAIYAIVKENPNAPLHAKNISSVLGCEDQEVQELFETLLEEELIEKKYASLSIYRITLKGMLDAGEAFKEYWQG